MRIIALEEEFVTEGVMRSMLGNTSAANYTLETSTEVSGEDISKTFVDLGERRIAAMDEAGIDIQVLSFCAPQLKDAGLSIELMREGNNRAAEAIKKYPSRYFAFASLPLADPAAAVAEFDRALGIPGFVGGFVAGSINGEFLDEEKYRPVLEFAESRNAPIYLHPYFPLPALMESYFRGRGELGGPEWAFMIDASCHFMRLVTSGTFDRFPQLRIILGHLGESIPFNLDRICNRLVAYAKAKPLMRPVEDYFLKNLAVTTSGNFSVPSLQCAINTLGIDNVMFSVDWPHESNKVAVNFLKHLPLGESDLEKVAHRNAERILNLQLT